MDYHQLLNENFNRNNKTSKAAGCAEGHLASKIPTDELGLLL